MTTPARSSAEKLTITAQDLETLGAALTLTDDADDNLDAVDTLLDSANTAAAAFGAAQTRIDAQNDFLAKQADALKNGVGAMVDADMEEASARLAALQTQQQLGIQALSIANQAPQNVLVALPLRAPGRGGRDPPRPLSTAASRLRRPRQAGSPRGSACFPTSQARSGYDASPGPHRARHRIRPLRPDHRPPEGDRRDRSRELSRARAAPSPTTSASGAPWPRT